MPGMWTSSSTSAGIEPLDLGHRRRARVGRADPAEPGRRRDDLARDVEEDRLVVDPEHRDLVRCGRAHPRVYPAGAGATAPGIGSAGSGSPRRSPAIRLTADVIGAARMSPAPPNSAPPAIVTTSTASGWMPSAAP